MSELRLKGPVLVNTVFTILIVNNCQTYNLAVYMYFVSKHLWYLVQLLIVLHILARWQNQEGQGQLPHTSEK